MEPNITKLYEIRSKYIEKNKDTANIDKLILTLEQKYIDILFEDEGGGAVVGAGGGMSSGGYNGGVAYSSFSNAAGLGPVTASQPSSIPGVLSDPAYSATGGSVGTDIGKPLGAKPTKQTGKKKKKSKKNTTGYENRKVMSFEEFTKDNLYQVNKVGESYEVEKLVLIEYWYNNMITPVKIIEKKGNRYLISHNITESEIQNAPNEWIRSSDIIDEYKKVDS